MTLQRFDGVLRQLQKEAPRTFDALVLLHTEVKKVLEDEEISSIITDGLDSIIGLQRNSTFRAVELSDIHDTLVIGDTSQPSGKLQVSEITNDHTAREVLTVKRAREDTVAPNAAFGAYIAFRLQGASIRTEPEVGRVLLRWEQNQTNDTTQRDSELSLWNMLNNTLQAVITIPSTGLVSFNSTAYPSGRIVFTGASGLITTDAGLLYDVTNDIVTILASGSTVGNAPLVIRQDSTADAYIRFTIGSAGNSFGIGIDNSDSDTFKIFYGSAGNATPGTNDYLNINIAGQAGYGVAPSSTVKFQIFKTTENICLAVAHSDALTTPSIQINQASTGDAVLQWTLGAGNSYAAGIDNSDSDKWKLSYGSAANAAMGTNDRVCMDTSGRLVINGATITSGRMLQINHIEEGTWIWCEGAFVNPAITLNNTNTSGKQYQIISTGVGGTGAAGAFVVRDNTGAVNRLIIDTNGNFVVGATAALATTATDGFLHIPSCAGTPTGVPTAYTGKIPLVYDSTNNILYARSGGAWRAH